MKTHKIQSLRRISTRPSKLWTSAFAQKERTSLLCQYSEQKKSKIIRLCQTPTYATASYPYGQKDCSAKCSHCPRNGILPCKGQLINKEGLDAITAVIHELEQAGYITRNRIRDEKGLLREMECTVYSSPRLNDSYDNNPIAENPTLDFPTQEKPMQ